MVAGRSAPRYDPCKVNTPERSKQGSRLLREVPPVERPRERMARLGGDALKDSELVAILLRTGRGGESVVDLAEGLLRRHRGLAGLARAGLDELMQTPGIGAAKAVELRAAFELARRLPGREEDRLPRIRSPEDAANMLLERCRDLRQERFWILMLNRKNEVFRVRQVASGTLDASLVDARAVFSEPLMASAAAVILAHNHPSGDPEPSSEDLQVTRVLAQAGKLLSIPVLDHLVIGRPTQGRRPWVSLAAEGWIEP